MEITKENRTWIDYTNSDNEQYNLLTVTKDGEITNEVPKIEE